MVSAATIALSLLSLALSVTFTLWVVLRWHINPTFFLQHVLRLIREDKTPKALRLAHAAGSTLYGKLIAAIITPITAAPDATSGEALAAAGAATREG